MGANPPSGFPVELWGGADADALTAHEQRLVAFAARRFGKPLARFLLSGLGEETKVAAWRFTVTFAGAQDAVHTREIEVEADKAPGSARVLPRRYEPLVMSALLRLLLRGRGALSSLTLSYGYGQVLDLLGWGDAKATRAVIDRAVETYALLSYRWALGGEELAERGLSSYRAHGRLISGYGHYGVEKAGEFKRLANNVDFSSVFVEGLKRRSLCGVDWNNISGIEREALRRR